MEIGRRRVRVAGRLRAAVLGRNPAGLGRESIRARWRGPGREELFRGGASSPDFAGGGGDVHRRREKDSLRARREERENRGGPHR